MTMELKVIREETQYIIQDLLRSRPKDDIIRDVCWRTKCTWQEGETAFFVVFLPQTFVPFLFVLQTSVDVFVVVHDLPLGVAFAM